jgi:hypothetical protein
MLRKLALIALLSIPALAQEVAMPGVFVTPVPNSPFSATVELHITKHLADGTTERVKSVHSIARDSRGRIYNESRRLVPLSFTGTPQLTSSHIFDPETRVNIFLNPFNHIAPPIDSKRPRPQLG